MSPLKRPKVNWLATKKAKDKRRVKAINSKGSKKVKLSEGGWK